MSRTLLAVIAAIIAVSTPAFGQCGPDLEVTVTTDKDTYVMWEPITVTVSAYNPWPVPVSLYWHNSCTTGYVMNYWYGLYPICLQVIVTSSIGPGETQTQRFQHRWSEYPLEVGTHTVYGYFFGRKSETIEFEVVAAPPEAGDVRIDFETIPGGAPLGDAPLASAYTAWGVSFTSTYGVNVATRDDNQYATVMRTSYPPGFHIIAELDVPAYAADVDVRSSTDTVITMLAKDADGDVIASVESKPCVWPEFQGPLTVRSDTPIHRLEWWPSQQNASVSIDNLVLARTPRRYGDVNIDGVVDLDDFNVLKRNFGATDATWADGDFNGDGVVDLEDFMLLKMNFGR